MSDDNLEELIDRMTENAPPLLWHYTTPEGLLGILQSGELFATGLPYLNDSSEGQYMTELVVSELTRRHGQPVASAINDSLDRIAIRSPLAVSCFCESGDLLGQWRAYAGGRGFAIGFDPKLLGMFWSIDRGDGMLSKVQYDLDETLEAAEHQAKFIGDAWAELVASGIEASQKDPTDHDIDAVAKGLFEFDHQIGFLAIAGAFHKPAHFSQEQEWRYVGFLARRGAQDPFPFEERATAFGIAIYRRIPFQVTPDASPIRAIRIGPGLDVQSQTATLTRVLSKYGYPDIEIDGSSVPLRF